MTGRFEIIGKDRSSVQLPTGSTVFVDTTGGDLLRDGTDLDLSHWYPNATPAEWRADTSTESALKYVAAHRDHGHLVVNDHADTDGVLSVFVMVEPELALAHAAMIRAAAEVGDFGFWANPRALTFYGWLADRRAVHGSRLNGNELFEACNRDITAYLIGDITPEKAYGAAAERIARSRDLIADGTALRTVITERLVRYEVPAALADQHRIAAGACRVDGQLSDVVWISHWARNAFDREQFQLVSVPQQGGWHHSFWVPQYLPWDTETLWRPAGLAYAGLTLTWEAHWPAIAAATAELSGVDIVSWTFQAMFAPWTDGFPVVVGHDHLSHVEPEKVAAILAPALELDLG